ncbi:MAG: class I adenylate-forming enzyme family protein [Promethearchaeota archaeon]
MTALPKLKYFWQYIPYWVDKDPDFPWIIYKDTTIQASELQTRILQMAQWMISKNIQKGDIIATVLPTCPEFLYVFFAAQMIGAITAALDVKYKEADIHRFLSMSNPKVVIFTSGSKAGSIEDILTKIKPEYPEIAHYISIDKSTAISQFLNDIWQEDFHNGEELTRRMENLDENEGCAIVFTGGSTGNPKGALLTHKNFVSTGYHESQFIIDQAKPLNISERPPVYNGLPNSHVGGLLELNSLCFLRGWQMIMDDTWHPIHQLDAIVQHKTPFFGGVPTMAKILLTVPNLKELDLSSLKFGLLSGEKISLELLEKFSKVCPRIINGYGSTEGGSEICMTEIGVDFKEIDQGYAGKPLPTMEIKIVDDDENEVATGQVGEVLVRGEFTSPQYYKQPEEDKAGFTPDGWCRMGDLGYLNEKGELYLQGRKKEIIRVGSYTVLPIEVETVAMEDSNIGLAAAIGYPDEIFNEVVWLVIVPKEGKIIVVEDVMERCKQNLAKFKVPKKIIVQKTLPYTHIGKVDRKKILHELINSQQE